MEFEVMYGYTVSIFISTARVLVYSYASLNEILLGVKRER
jgi:hypothetical protein